MKKIISFSLLVGWMCVLTTACSKKTETEQLAEMRDSFSYSKYQLLSSNGLALGLSAYEKGVQFSGAEKMPELTASDICLARTLLAYGALIANKNSVALAESDLIDKEKCDPFLTGAASSMRGVIYHREKWPGLAAEETQKSKNLLNTLSDKEQTQNKLISLHVALGTNAFMQKDYAAAQTHADALGLVLELPWLGDVSHTAVLFQQGKFTDAVRETKRLSENASVPTEVRDQLASFVKSVENKTGDVDAPAFMLRLVTRSVWDKAIEQSSGAMARVSGFVKSQMNKLGVDAQTDNK